MQGTRLIFLLDIFARVGVPREVLSECGVQFTSELMCELSRLLSLWKLLKVD